LSASERMPCPAWRVAVVSNRANVDGDIPVLFARVRAVADRWARHRRLLEHADDVDSHRSAAGHAIPSDGDRDGVHWHRAARCAGDRRAVGTAWACGGDPYNGRLGRRRIRLSLDETDRGALCQLALRLIPSF